jgi:alkyl sulfatase BDS1-like metallo-beta-lactamase superfamily hydrolase
VVVQHHWPVWGRERIAEYVAGQRDMYRYLHDQTLRLMSHGLTPKEIGDALMMPTKLSRQWFARGYYGAVAHNVNAVYAHYLGPYDGNPANLDPLPPERAGAQYVAYMGGAEAVVKRAREDFEAGHFRWVVEVLNHVVFAEPKNRAARDLAADAMEQLGYQTESATWRNAYLLGARELRAASAASAPRGVAISPDIVAVLPLGSFLEFLAIRVNGTKAQDLDAKFDWRLVDDAGIEAHRSTLSNGALNHLPGSHGAAADAMIELTRAQLSKLSAGRSALLAALDAGDVKASGNGALFRRFVETLDEFDPMFNVIEP